MERQRGEGRGVEVTHNLVQAGDLLIQKVVFLLGDLLPLLGDLQSLQQLSVLHVQVVDQHVRFAVLVPLEEFRQRGRSFTFGILNSSSSPSTVRFSFSNHPHSMNAMDSSVIGVNSPVPSAERPSL